MKKRKEEILRIKEQSSVHSTEQSSVKSTKQPSVQPTVQSDYVYGAGIVPVLAIGICVFFAYNTFQPKNKKQANEKQDQQPKRRHML